MSRSFHGKQSTCCAPLDKWTRWLLQVHQVRQGLTLLQQRQVRQRRLRQPRQPRTLQAVRPRRRRLRRRTQRRKMNCQGRAHASRTLSEECRLTKQFVALFGRNRCPRQPVALCPRVRTRSLRLLWVMRRLPVLRQLRVLRQLPVLRRLRVLRLPPVLRRLPLRPQASNGSRPKNVCQTLQERPYWPYRHRTAASPYGMTALESSVHDLGIGVTVAQLTLTQFV